MFVSCKIGRAFKNFLNHLFDTVNSGNYNAVNSFINVQVWLHYFFNISSVYIA